MSSTVSPKLLQYIRRGRCRFLLDRYLSHTPQCHETKKICTLPISISVNKKPNDHSQHVPNTKSKEGDHRVIKNKSPNIAWKLKNTEAYKEVFTESTLKYCQMFNNIRHLCRRYASKEYCFKYCKIRAIHYNWLNKINYSYAYYQKKCRKIPLKKTWRPGGV